MQSALVGRAVAVMGVVVEEGSAVAGLVEAVAVVAEAAVGLVKVAAVEMATDLVEADLGATFDI